MVEWRHRVAPYLATCRQRNMATICASKYHSERDSKILDLCIVSPGLASKMSCFSVLAERDMGSDHVPIMATFEAKPYREKSCIVLSSFNTDKAKWDMYAKELTQCTPDEATHYGLPNTDKNQ